MEVAKRGHAPVVILRLILLSCAAAAVSPTSAFARNARIVPPTPLIRQQQPSSSPIISRHIMAAAPDDYDYEKLFASPAERSRKERRSKVMYDHKDWLRHRSSDRFFRNLGNIPSSAIFLNLLDEVAVTIGVCVVVILWNEMLFDGYVDFANVHHDAPLGGDNLVGWVLPTMRLPTLPFTLSSGALGLLLVFRTNASYSRFTEGRAAWDDIVGQSRNILLQASVWSKKYAGGGEEDETEGDCKSTREEGLERLGISTWALTRSVRKHLSGEWDPDEEYAADIRNEMKEYPKQAERLLSARHLPFRAIYDLQGVVWDLDLDSDQKAQLAQSATCIGDACVNCERIYTTPVPLSYTRHTARFLTLWLLLLPLALYDAFGASWNHFSMMPAVAVLSLLLFGIEEIAVSLEEPFSILPLDKLVDDSRLAAADVQMWMHEDDE